MKGRGFLARKDYWVNVYCLPSGVQMAASAQYASRGAADKHQMDPRYRWKRVCVLHVRLKVG